MRIPTEYINFPTRETRTRFIASHFADILKDSVLDIGCFEAPLRDLLTGVSYTGVDMVGHPDIQLNLEEIERLPFDDGAFRCVMCIDVLEHLDNLHALFAELVRVSNRYILVSLPNCWCDARRAIERGRGHFGHYGLPLEKPNDRHKWFFGLSEARAFIEGKTAEFHLTAHEMLLTEKPRNVLLRTLRRMRYPGEAYQNRYSRTLWTVLRKSE